MKRMIAILLILSLCPLCLGDMLDWRDMDGKNYVTPVRNQRGAGTCWAFAAIGAVESRWLIQNDLPGVDVDLSEQHLVCQDPIRVRGGWVSVALQNVWDIGVVSEEELPYTATGTSPNWPLALGWEDRVWKLEMSGQNALDPFTKLSLGTSNDDPTGYWERNATIKQALYQYGPVVSLICVKDMVRKYIPPPDDWEPGFCSRPRPHAILIVGYQDTDDVSGGYWIFKNSWGTRWGDNGFLYVRYGDVEKYAEVHVITGDVIPEPMTFSIICVGFVCILHRFGHTE